MVRTLLSFSKCFIFIHVLFNISFSKEFVCNFFSVILLLLLLTFAQAIFLNLLFRENPLNGISIKKSTFARATSKKGKHIVDSFSKYYYNSFHLAKTAVT